MTIDVPGQPAVSIVGESAPHAALFEKIRKIAPLKAEVLITGPTGSGKEMYARLVHALSSWAAGPFVPLNCGAVPSDLFENELFGHACGAYTGARVPSEGLAAAAEGGTLFLDEVDALSLSAQVKLLRFVQHFEYRRLGESSLRRASVRIIAATNADLSVAIAAGRFRDDLYFRLCVIPLEVPPLAERPADIFPLTELFAEHYAQEYHLPRIVFSDEARVLLREYHWPGNVRELENCVRQLTCEQLTRPVKPADLPLRKPPTQATTTREIEGLDLLPFQEAKRKLILEFEKQYLETHLRRANGNVSVAARASKQNRRAFFEIMRKHGLTAAAARLARPA